MILIQGSPGMARDAGRSFLPQLCDEPRQAVDGLLVGDVPGAPLVVLDLGLALLAHGRLRWHSPRVTRPAAPRFISQREALADYRPNPINGGYGAKSCSEKRWPHMPGSVIPEREVSRGARCPNSNSQRSFVRIAQCPIGSETGPVPSSAMLTRSTLRPETSHPLVRQRARYLRRWVRSVTHQPDPGLRPSAGYLDELVILPLGILAVVRLIPSEVMAESRAAAAAAVDKPVRRTAASMIALIWVASIALTYRYFRTLDFKLRHYPAAASGLSRVGK